ncbi:MAG: hypothetical protein JWM59_4413 [Verrucomicrobiales bacterium]|nr:hypothetical protein [Verrucomicrobiales bacterium]
MRTALSPFLLAAALASFPVSHGSTAELEVVASFPKQQVTGIGVSKASGRIFVNFPFWSDDHTISVAEVGKDGNLTPFPDAEWNRKDEGSPDKRFVCIQSVVVDDRDTLWILDAGSPKQQGVVPGAAKLVKVDLASNQVVKVYPMEDTVAPKKSYLNDIRVDTATGHAFITESGIGSLIVINLESGEQRRLLANHPSTKAEIGTELVVDSIRPIDPETAGTPQFHADGIALDAKNGWLYFHALTGYQLYRIRTSVLTDPKATMEKVGKAVEKVAKTAAPDGMLEDAKGRVYLAAFEKNAIIRFDPDSGESTTVVEDNRLQWPDTLSWGPNGDLYVTTSQIHRTPKYNRGVSKLEGPFQVLKVSMEKP